MEGKLSRAQVKRLYHTCIIHATPSAGGEGQNPSEDGPRLSLYIEIFSADRFLFSLRYKDTEWKGSKHSIRFEKLQRFRVVNRSKEASCRHYLGGWRAHLNGTNLHNLQAL